jgi:hypothetical protein
MSHWINLAERSPVPFQRETIIPILIRTHLKSSIYVCLWSTVFGLLDLGFIGKQIGNINQRSRCRPLDIAAGL